MLKENIHDLISLVEVVHQKSFTKAAAKLGISQSALSHSISNLEKRLQVRLLMRTTRSVATTEAGEALLAKLEPLFSEINQELIGLAETRGHPTRQIRLSAGEHAMDWVLWPALKPFLKMYPDISVEITVDNSLIDIVNGRFDAGVRLGEHLAKDMIAMRISQDMRMAVVGSSDYFACKGIPQTPQALAEHDCINMRLPTMGDLFIWEFSENGKVIKIRAEGQLTFNTLRQRIDAAIHGFGLAFVPKDTVTKHLAEGTLICVLENYCPSFSGYHLYYPSRKQHTTAFSLLLDALRV